MRRAVFFGVSIALLFAAAGHAAESSVDCSSATLQAAIDRAKPGEALLVTGVCKENVTVPEEVSRVILDGQGKATIHGPDASKPTIVVKGRGITLKGFTVSGGRDAINVTQGGQAVLDGNTVERAGRNGVEVNRLSDAVLVNNTVQDNPGNGVLISSNAAARIGFLSTLEETASPNLIQKNGRDGIVVNRSSSARLVGNTIRNNGRNGVNVMRASQADITSNTIDGNGLNGVEVSQQSTVRLGAAPGGNMFQAANATDSKNSEFGIKCTIQSSAVGGIGTLGGEQGSSQFGPSCVDGLTKEK